MGSDDVHVVYDRLHEAANTFAQASANYRATHDYVCQLIAGLTEDVVGDAGATKQFTDGFGQVRDALKAISDRVGAYSSNLTSVADAMQRQDAQSLKVTDAPGARVPRGAV